MRRHESVYEHYLACALLLVLAECSFFYTDSDTEIGRYIRRLMEMTRSQIPDFVGPVDGESVTMDVPRESRSLVQTTLQDALSATAAKSSHDKAWATDNQKENTIQSLPWVSQQRDNQRNHTQKGVIRPGLSAIRPDVGLPSISSRPEDLGRSMMTEHHGTFRGSQGSNPVINNGSINQRSSQQRFSAPPMDKTQKSLRDHLRPWAEDIDWDGSGRHQISGRSVGTSFSGRGGISNKTRSVRTLENPKMNRETRVRNASIHSIPYASLRRLLGYGVLQPPQGHLKPPDFFHLKNGRMPAMPDGKPLVLLPLQGERVEHLNTPDAIPEYRQWLAQEKSVSGPHWHAAGPVNYFHEGPLWAIPVDNGWTPVVEADKHWWTLADGNQPLIRHQGHWWWKEGDTWFLLHQGQPWAYRWFGQWQQSGLINPRTDTRIIYSADEEKAAVITPGKDTVLFDLRTGEEIRRWNARRRAFNGR